jgi:glycosyltransferase involved in cell wall biosynthesis
MRILCVTSLFPSRLQPNRGLFNWRHFARLKERAEVRVISPIAWTTAWRARRSGSRVASGGRPEEWNGVAVEYPRYYYPPGAWRGAHGSFLKMSIARSFRRAVAEFQPDIVYACYAYPDGWAAWRLAREADLPVAVKVHGSDLLLLPPGSGRRRRTVEMLLDINALCAVSNDLKNCAVRLGISEARAHVIYSGTDRELFCPGDRRAARRALGLDSEGLRLLFVGNLVPVKAIPNLVEACAKLYASGLQFEADLIGDGHLRATLERQIAGLGLAGRMHLRGSKQQTEMPQWYRAADLVVLPSLSEGVPNVLIEAVACGTPFVATNVGGIPEIAHLSPGALVPAGDPGALARAIDAALQNSEGAAARINPAAVPSVSTCAEATLNLFAQIIADRGRSTFEESHREHLAHAEH